MDKRQEKSSSEIINSDDYIRSLCFFLIERFSEEKREKNYAKTKEALSLIGKGILLVSVFLAPGVARVLPKIESEIDREARDFWKYAKYYNLGELRKTIKRLRRQKMVSILTRDGKEYLALTEKGKKKVLKYAIEELELKKQSKWDGKWRLAIYDIQDRRKAIRDAVRSTLERLGFLKLQESVYLIPYPCEEEIEFLRTYYYLRDEIRILEVSKIEYDQAYKKFFVL